MSAKLRAKLFGLFLVVVLALNMLACGGPKCTDDLAAQGQCVKAAAESQSDTYDRLSSDEPLINWGD